MRLPAGSTRQQFMGIFGPLSLPAPARPVGRPAHLRFRPGGLGAAARHSTRRTTAPSFGTAFYASGVTFFTLGYGDIMPRTALARFVAVTEAGVGFGFLALVIGYLPVLYQAFSRREATISRLDARASSPATATEMLRRYGKAGALGGLDAYLRDWEQWASEILESHLSYPVLTYYRSQHEHQSWLSALMAIMDTCTLVIVGFDDAPQWEADLQWQAQMTYAMARHAIIDLAYTFNACPRDPDEDRLPPEKLARIRATLAGVGLPLCDGAGGRQEAARAACTCTSLTSSPWPTSWPSPCPPAVRRRDHRQLADQRLGPQQAALLRTCTPTASQCARYNRSRPDNDHHGPPAARGSPREGRACVSWHYHGGEDRGADRGDRQRAGTARGRRWSLWQSSRGRGNTVRPWTANRPGRSRPGGTYRAAEQTVTLRGRVTIPEDWAGQRVFLALEFGGAETLVYVDGQPAQAIDNQHHELLLADPAEGGRTYDLALAAYTGTADAQKQGGWSGAGGATVADDQVRGDAAHGRAAVDRPGDRGAVL